MPIFDMLRMSEFSHLCQIHTLFYWSKHKILSILPCFLKIYSSASFFSRFITHKGGLLVQNRTFVACRECPVLHIYDKFTHCDSGINSKQYCFLVLLCNQMFSKMYFVICALKRGSDGGLFE